MGEFSLICLGCSGQQGCHGCDSNAPADIAHQIINPAGVSHLFLRKPTHGGGGERDENETHGQAVDHHGKNNRAHSDFHIDVAQHQSGEP